MSKKYGFLIFIPILLGFFISFYSWDGVVYFFERDSSRIPADNNTSFNLSKLKSRIQRSSYKKIISNLTVTTRSNDLVNLNFKNFYLKNQRLSVCKVYKNIQLSFVALNVAVSGELPTIQLNSICTEDESNSEYISTISIPLDDIKNLEPSSGEPFLFENSSFSFLNIVDQWPLDFRLDKITFYNPKEDKKLTIDVFNSKPSIEFQL